MLNKSCVYCKTDVHVVQRTALLNPLQVYLILEEESFSKRCKVAWTFFCTLRKWSLLQKPVCFSRPHSRSWRKTFTGEREERHFRVRTAQIVTLIPGGCRMTPSLSGETSWCSVIHPHMVESYGIVATAICMDSVQLSEWSKLNSTLHVGPHPIHVI